MVSRALWHRSNLVLKHRRVEGNLGWEVYVMARGGSASGEARLRT